MHRYTFEAWYDPDDNSIMLGKLEDIAVNKEKKLLSKNSELLYQIAADTPEEASAIHYLRQGWGPYKPVGEAEECPHERSPRQVERIP